MKLLPIKNTCLTLEEVSLILKARFTTVRLDQNPGYISLFMLHRIKL